MSNQQSWRATRAEVVQRLAAAGIVTAEAEARFLVEEVSGYSAADWPNVADDVPTARARARLWPMVERRVVGEPLQYVLGSWSFRGLDLMVDRRVLIPRPETEQVVEVALEEAQRRGLRRVRRRHLTLVDAEPPAVVADIGTGSGAIALALDAELPDVTVWATDVSAEALDVAHTATSPDVRPPGCVPRWGPGSTRCPTPFRGRLELAVSNPPYIAESEVGDLRGEVADYEPRAALVSGPTGREALEHLLAHAREWLVPGGALVCELAPHQAKAMVEWALRQEYTEAFVRTDLAGRPRVLVAHAG